MSRAETHKAPRDDILQPSKSTSRSYNMFAKPRPKKSLLPPPPKKRKVFAIEEISFDNSAREEYLTGFHKRKVQRQKHAQEEAAKTARAEKIEMRKQVCLHFVPDGLAIVFDTRRRDAVGLYRTGNK